MSAEYAAAIALELDRIRIAISRAAAAHVGPLAPSFGVAPSALSVFALLRNLAPSRRVPRAAVVHATMYQPPIDGTLSELETAGLIVAGSSGQVALTAAGVAAVERVTGVVAGIIEDAWSDRNCDFAELRRITGGAMDAATATAGLAYSVVAPVFEPPSMPAATKFAESLTPLRFHRFDAHIAAWQAAGLTLAEIQALADGPVKAAIEADTNRRSAAPYAALSEPDRATLLDALRALPAPGP